jgi:3-deoxy-D-manno-octulosonic-acid transferase
MTAIWYGIYRIITSILIRLLQLVDWVAPNWRARKLRLPRERLWPEPVNHQVDVWFHAVSLGEAQVLWAILKQIPESQRRNWLVTASTEAGIGLLQKQLPADNVRYMPVDNQGLYKKLLKGQKPNLVLTETELWPNLFKYLGPSAKILVINARLSEVSLRSFMPWRRLLMQMAQRINTVYARNTQDAARFKALGTPADRVKAVGNIKYDIKVPQLSHETLRQWLSAGSSPLLFASISTDEAALLAPQLAILKACHPQERILWVPRHLGPDDIAEHQKQLAAFNPVLFSQYQCEHPAPEVMILDIFGQLSACYASARLAVVGGSFNQRGGQNFLEPMQVGTAVMVGPNTRNFQSETEDAIQAGALVQLENEEALAPAVLTWLEHPEKMQKTVVCATQFLDQHRGAIAQTIQGLVDWDIVHLETLKEHP